MTLPIVGTLAIVAWTDGICHEIPDNLIGVLIACGVAQNFWNGTVLQGIVGCLICGLPPLFLAISLKRVSIGGGDVKLCAAMGLLSGPINGLLVILAALILLALYGLITRKKNTPIPFAPFVLPVYVAVTMFL